MASSEGCLRVAVVGAGVVGLSTAYHLIEKFGSAGVSVTVIADKFSPHTTSDKAGGLIEPVSFNSEGDANDARLRRWTRDTLEHLRSLYHSPVAAEIELSLVSGYDFRPHTEQLPWWKDTVYGFRQVPVDSHEIQSVVTPPPSHTDMCAWAFSSFMLDCRRYLPWLLQEITNRGGLVERRKLGSFGELGDYDVVINCTGLGAIELVSDERGLTPVRGQVVQVRAPWIKQFIISNSIGRNEDMLYIFPRPSDVILGGTAVVGEWSETVDHTTSERIVSRCATFCPSLRKAEVMGAWVGGRPFRTTVRLEKEESVSGQPLVIHNYGHGGQGLTIHWGCALDVGRILEKFLSERLRAHL